MIGPGYAQSKDAPRQVPKIAKGSPDVIWITPDDAGFGASSAFGGMAYTPMFAARASNGLR